MYSPESNNAVEVRENELLAGLPVAEFDRILPQLERVILPPFEVLYDFEEEITHVYFPNRHTIVSSLCRSDEHVNVEVGLSGNEGVVGLSGLLASANSPYQHLVQAPGTASRLTLAAARQEFGLGGPFQAAVLSFSHSVLVQISQTALCNRIHSDQERLARWLLLSDDRVLTHQLPLPRALLAKMLGRSLSGVTVAVTILERAGLVTYNGSELQIVDRNRLESAACSCYWTVRRQIAARAS